jgi:copper chaperone
MSNSNAKFNVSGMTCGHCVSHVKEALEATNGVVSAAVDLEAKTADVEFNSEISAAELAAVIDAAGYPAVAA